MNRLKNKVAIITGAAGGMGLAIARIFAEEGAKVVATDIQEDLLSEEIEKLKANGLSVEHMVLDVSSKSNWQEVVAKTAEKFQKIDILVNNAGIQIVKGILETDENTWQKIIDINSKSVFLGTQCVIPEMQKVGKGSIVNISSIGGILGGQCADGGGAAYSASKGAVRSFTKHTAQMFAKDSIRANSIHPGGIATPMALEVVGVETIEELKALGVSPLPPKMGDPEDIAYGALYLASDESGFVTGTELVIDGGFISQ